MNVAPPEDLTLPRPGSTTARDVLSRAIARLPHDLRDVLRRGGPSPDLLALAGAVRGHAAAFASVLRRPNVSALVRCLRAANDPPLLAELVTTALVELAAVGALERPVTITAPSAHVVSLAGGFALDLPARATVTVSEHSIVVRGPLGEVDFDLRNPTEIEARGVRMTRPFHPIEGDMVLALADNNPLSMLEAHPNKSGNRIDLGGKPASEWCDSLRGSLACVAQHLPDVRAEMDLYVQQFVPVGFDAESHLSASYREAIGTIYLTLHPQPMTMTEALIHEFSHNKINALFEIDDVLHNAFAPLFKSPVRPDPRPLHGVLLAVHAFIPVARLYECMREAGDPASRHPSFESRFAKIVAGNHEGIEVLRAHAEPTPAGRAVLDELIAWDRHFTG